MFDFHSEKIKNLNEKAKKLVDLVEYFDESEIDNSNINTVVDNDSSWIHKPQQTSNVDRIRQEPYRKFTEDITTEEYISVVEYYNNKVYGFGKENFAKVNSLVNILSNDEAVSKGISANFILFKTFFWLFREYNKENTKSFFDFIKHEGLQSIKKYQLLLPVMGLEIVGEYEIGNSKLTYITTDFVDRMEAYDVQEGNLKGSDFFTDFRKSYQGQVFVETTVVAEREKAIEIAYEESGLAIDSLKICSITTTDFPKLKIVFDIDKRMRVSDSNIIIIHNPNLTIHTTMNPEFELINHITWPLYEERGLADFDRFLVSRNTSKCELADLITNAINRFAEALSKSDLHQRIVDMLSILDSLLLKDSLVPITDTIASYCSKLVAPDVDTRRFVIKVIKDLYRVRSGVIHHGRKDRFKIEDLICLQRTMLTLLTVLMEKMNIHKTKSTLLNEIDEAILGAG